MPPEAAALHAGLTAGATAEGARPLRVLMVLESDFNPKGGGGAESQLRTLATHLRRIGQQVTVLTPLLARGPQVTAQRYGGIPVGRLRYPRVPKVGGVIMSARFAAFLLGRGRRYDAWHVHIGHHLGAVTCLLGSLLGKPVVVKISGWWELEQGVMAPGKKKLLDRVAQRWLKRAGTVQAISTRIAGELARQGFPAERILVLPNAVDTARFKVRAAPRAAGAPFTAVFVGRLVPEKELGTLLDAWAQAFAGRDDVRLRIVGGGPLAEPLRAQAERLGIARQVELLGPRERVEEVLAEADVGVLPSRIEGLSNTLLEFMATGLPTLASQVSGSEDFVVTGKNGWLFPVGDAGALAAGLREAAALPPERLAAIGRQARADVEAAASLEIVVGRLLALYRGARPAELRKAG
ncbi:MAG TPA: glycosyltransferase family 4 protein [Polyangia bacterium]|nr:glycosyltransferase family 4 protein [Polyangia bacterium]